MIVFFRMEGLGHGVCVVEPSYNKIHSLERLDLVCSISCEPDALVCRTAKSGVVGFGDVRRIQFKGPSCALRGLSCQGTLTEFTVTARIPTKIKFSRLKVDPNYSTRS